MNDLALVTVTSLVWLLILLYCLGRNDQYWAEKHKRAERYWRVFR